MAKRSKGGNANIKALVKTGAQLAGAAGAGYLGAAFLRKQVDKQLESQAMKNDTRALVRAVVAFGVGIGGMYLSRKKITDIYRYAFGAGAGVASAESVLEHSALADVASKIREVTGDESTTIAINSPADVARVLQAVSTVSPARASAVRQIAGTLQSPLSGTLSAPLSGDPFQSAYEGNLQTQLVGNAGLSMIRAAA